MRSTTYDDDHCVVLDYDVVVLNDDDVDENVVDEDPHSQFIFYKIIVTTKFVQLVPTIKMLLLLTTMMKTITNSQILEATKFVLLAPRRWRVALDLIW